MNMIRKKNHRKLHIKNGIAVTGLAAMLLLSFGRSDVYAADDVYYRDNPYPHGYGEGNTIEKNKTADTFYQWVRVTEENKPLYEFVPGGTKNTEFRLLLVASYKDTDGAYYEANWTYLNNYASSEGRFGNGQKYRKTTRGCSLIKPESNPMIRDCGTSFITRGALRSFRAEYANFYDNSHKNLFKYKLYAPNADDSAKEARLLYLEDPDDSTYSRALMYSNIDRTHAMGSKASADSWKNSYFSVKEGRKGLYDTWTIYSSQKDQRMGVCARMNYGLGRNFFSFVSMENENAVTTDEHYYIGGATGGDLWRVFVGYPIEVENLIGSGKTEASLTGSYTIDELSYIPENTTLTVDKNASLIVEKPLILNGRIENQGKIIVRNGGCIIYMDLASDASNDGGKHSQLYMTGGDLVVESGAAVVVNKLVVSNDKDSNRVSEIVGYDNSAIYTKHSFLQSGIADISSKGKLEANTVLYNYNCIKVVEDKSKKNAKKDYKFDISALMVDGHSQGENRDLNTFQRLNNTK